MIFTVDKEFIEQELEKQFNCIPKQMPRGKYDSIEVIVKNTVKKKFLGIFAISQPDIKKTISFNESYTVSRQYVYLDKVKQRSRIDTALDLDNMVIYWRYK